jgi:ribosomal protein S6
MPLYESIFYLAPRISLDLTKRILKDRLTNILNRKGFIRRFDNMGIIPLAYPMYRHQGKYYEARSIYVLFDAGTECLKEYEDDLKSTKEIFRHVIYKQGDKFRDAFDEMFYHHGVESGKTFDAHQNLLRQIEQDVSQRIAEGDKIEYVEPKGEDEMHWNFMTGFKERLEANEMARQSKEKFQDDLENERLRILDQQKLKK